MKRLFSALFLFVCLIAPAQAQIGYQVSLLNTATGKPQANKTVNVNITITNAENEVVHTEIQTATTNDFGILSLSVGNENTFKNADWNKLPFYIAVSADGTLIGKSQILTVPVAEYAKTAGTVLTKEMVVGTWKWGYTSFYDAGDVTSNRKVDITYKFNSDGSGLYTDGSYSTPFDYDIVGRHIYLYMPMENWIQLDMSSFDQLTSSTYDYALLDFLLFIPPKNVLVSGTKSGIILIKQ